MGSAREAIKAVEAIADAADRAEATAALIRFTESPALAPYFKQHYGFALFSTIGKGGIGIGGAHGKGFVVRKGKLSGRTSMTQVTIGFQLGGQAFSQIIFFEDKDAYENFTSGNFELGAQASAVALTAGASAQADTAAGASAAAGKAQARRNYSNGMAIFTMAKGGLMYEASVGGQKFTFRKID